MHLTEKRYDNIDRRQDLAFNERDIEKMIKFYKLDQFHWNFHRNRLVDYLRTGVMKKPCTAGFNYFFVRSNGEVFPCPLIKIGLGNFKETKVVELFFFKRSLPVSKTGWKIHGMSDMYGTRVGSLCSSH